MWADVNQGPLCRAAGRPSVFRQIAKEVAHGQSLHWLLGPTGKYEQTLH